MAEWLNRRLAHSTRVLVSPALRCQQTAKALGRKFRTVEAIAPGASAEALLDRGRLARCRRSRCSSSATSRRSASPRRCC